MVITSGDWLPCRCLDAGALPRAGAAAGAAAALVVVDAARQRPRRAWSTVDVQLQHGITVRRRMMAFAGTGHAWALVFAAC